MKDLDERLVELINQNSSVTLEMQDVADELDLAEKLGMDSMSFVQLIIALESEFGIEFSEDKLLIDYIKRYGNLKECIISQLM